MSDINTTKQEKDDLSLHVDLCAQRYMILEKRLEILEVKFDLLSQDIAKANSSLKVTIITSAVTLVGGLCGIIITLLMKF